MQIHGLIRPHQSKLEVLFKLTDALIIVGLFRLFLIPAIDSIWSERHALAIFIAVTMFYVSANNFGLYRSWRIRPQSDETTKVFVSWGASLFILFLVANLLDVGLNQAPQGTSAWLVSVPIALTAWRLSLRSGLRRLRQRGYNTRSAAIVGMTEVGDRLANDLDASNWTGVNIVGIFDDRYEKDATRTHEPSSFEHVGTLSDLVEKASNAEIDVVFITFPFAAEQRIFKLINELRNTTASVYIAQDYGAYELLHGSWFLCGSTPIISIFESPFLGVEGFTKRLFDIFASFAASIVLIPVFLIIAVCVKTTSSGPVFFNQRRYGLDGREIYVKKFRTMRTMEDGNVVEQTKRDDPRVTRVGMFLRRTSLDELPQLLNVLAGSMSLIGPRPHAVAHNEEFRKLVPDYMLRHKVKPGITGLAQVNGFRGEIESYSDIERRVHYDLMYIANYSFLLDIRIIFQTLWCGFVDKKAY
jgi:putative colanic acid biosynthesis UDP-glucose lipid carrier transferase